MRYEGAIWRPPSEARSYLLQVTMGCTHNECTFCSMYRDKPFRVRNVEEVIEDLHMARRAYSYIDRVFLCDGDALCLSNEKLLYIISKIYEILPEVSRVSTYGAPADVLKKSHEELVALREAGLEFVYIGAESGSDIVLKDIKKGATRAEIIEAVQKIEAAGLKASVTFISGLGGKKNWREHAVETGTMISQLGASYVGVLTLLLDPSAPMYKDLMDGTFELLSAEEVVEETMLMMEHINVPEDRPCVFRMNHATNYVALKGNLPADKERFMAQLEYASKHQETFRDERFRAH
ncbi:MAG: radical SAM protein [Eubacterium sp.]|nr:radical SAM protein [Eubacterium sp.]